MKAATYSLGGTSVVAMPLGDHLINVTEAWTDYNTVVEQRPEAPRLKTVACLLEQGLFHRSFYRRICEFVQRHRRLEKYILAEDATLAMPLRPGKVIAIGKNYREHVKEFDGEVPEEPLFFIKSATACIGPNAPIIIEDWYGRVDHEGEYGVVIGKQARHVAAADARDYVAGYTLLNDVTAREIQRADIAKGKPWFRAKNLDTFCPLGPAVVMADAIAWPLEEDIQLRVNGEVRQQSNTRVFIFDLPTLIEYVTRHMTLEVGDVIATGTPEGVSPLKPGDVVEVEAAELGVLSNPVIAR